MAGCTLGKNHSPAAETVGSPTPGDRPESCRPPKRCTRPSSGGPRSRRNKVTLVGGVKQSTFFGGDAYFLLFSQYFRFLYLRAIDLSISSRLPAMKNHATNAHPSR